MECWKILSQCSSWLLAKFAVSTSLSEQAWQNSQVVLMGRLVSSSYSYLYSLWCLKFIVQIQKVYSQYAKNCFSRVSTEFVPTDPADHCIYTWDVSKFCRVPKGYWKNKQNQRNALQQLESSFYIKDPSDWAKVPWIVFKTKLKGDSLINQYGSVSKFLSAMYPEHTFPLNTRRGE